jgi:hypothetical protein
MSHWTNKQSNHLRNLVRKNLVNYTNLEPNYLFKVTQEHFPNFMGRGPSARNSAIQRLHKKFWILAKEFAINGGRLLGESFVSLNVHASQQPSLVSYFSDKDINKGGKKEDDKDRWNRLTSTRQRLQKKPLLHLECQARLVLLIHPKRHILLPALRRT